MKATIHTIFTRLLLPCISLCLVCGSSYGNIDPTNKCVWAENIGWVNASPTNEGMAVHFNGTSGYLSGFVWGENIGWINMGTASGGSYLNTTDSNWGVNIDEEGNLSGLAWGENVGWINFESEFNSVAINKATGRFDGYAWGENIGWLHFIGGDADGLRTTIFDTQPNGVPNWWLAAYGVTEDYEDGDQIPAWQEYIADTDPTNPLSFLKIISLSVQPTDPLVTVSFLSSPRRYYSLQKCINIQAGGWEDVPSQASILGIGGLYSLQDSTASSQQVYRINVSVTP